MSLSKLLTKSQLSIRSEASIQLQHYSKLLPHSKLREANHPHSSLRLEAPLQQTARPGYDGQGDSAPQLLQKAHQCCVGHSPCTFPIHLQQDVPTPAQRRKKSKWYMGHLNMDTYKRFFCFAMGWIPYPAIIVGRRPLYDGADKKGLIAVDLLLTSHDAEAQAA